MKRRRDWGPIAIGMRVGADAVSTPTVVSLISMLMQGLRPGDVFLSIQWRNYHHVAADELAQRFLRDTECQSLLYIDADQTFQPDALERLRSNKHGKEFDILGGLYVDRIKGYPHAYRFSHLEYPTYNEQAERARADEVKNLFGIDLPVLPEAAWQEIYAAPRPMYEKLSEWPEGRVIEVDALGLGFTMFRREVFEKMSQPWFYFKTPQTGEDITVSYDARQAGFRIGLDTSLEIGHLHTRAIHWSETKQIIQAQARERGAA